MLMVNAENVTDKLAEQAKLRQRETSPTEDDVCTFNHRHDGLLTITIRQLQALPTGL